MKTKQKRISRSKRTNPDRIRQEYNSGEAVSILAQRYGLTHARIYQIIHNKNTGKQTKPNFDFLYNSIKTMVIIPREKRIIITYED